MPLDGLCVDSGISLGSGALAIGNGTSLESAPSGSLVVG